MAPIQLRREHLDAMIAHARETAPEECCGLIGGLSETLAATLYPLRNVTPNPELGYEAAPEDLFAAQRQMRERGQSLLPHVRGGVESAAWSILHNPQVQFFQLFGIDFSGSINHQICRRRRFRECDHVSHVVGAG